MGMTDKPSAEQAPAGQAKPSEYWWDQNSVNCGNCSVEIVARKSSIPQNHNALSHEEGEEESLCGYCAGEELRRIADQSDALRSQLAQLSTTREIARAWEEKEAACCPEDVGFPGIHRCAREGRDEARWRSQECWRRHWNHSLRHGESLIVDLMMIRMRRIK